MSRLVSKESTDQISGQRSSYDGIFPIFLYPLRRHLVPVEIHTVLYIYISLGYYCETLLDLWYLYQILCLVAFTSLAADVKNKNVFGERFNIVAHGLTVKVKAKASMILYKWYRSSVVQTPTRIKIKTSPSQLWNCFTVKKKCNLSYKTVQLGIKSQQCNPFRNN